MHFIYFFVNKIWLRNLSLQSAVFTEMTSSHKSKVDTIRCQPKLQLNQLATLPAKPPPFRLFPTVAFFIPSIQLQLRAITLAALVQNLKFENAYINSVEIGKRVTKR